MRELFLKRDGLLWMMFLRRYQQIHAAVEKTITGALLHITDALAKPAKKFTATLEPVKVTGKNLFNKNNFVRNEGWIDPNHDDFRLGEGRNTAVLPDPIPIGTYTISRATSARLRVGLVTSTTLTQNQAVTNKVSGTNNSNTPVTITVSQSGYYLAIFFKDTADADEQYLLDHLQVEVGSSATEYEDYTCTFTGHTGANVVRTGKNLFDKTQYSNIITGRDYISGSHYACKIIQLSPNTTYTVSQGSGVAQTDPILLLHNKPRVNDNGYFDFRKENDVKTFTTDSTGQLYIGAVNSNDSACYDRINACNVQIELGSTASAYEPYSGTTIPITFPVLGKNLLDMSDANIEVGKYIDNSGAEKTNGSNFYNTAYVPVKASTAYTLSTSTSIKYCSFMEYDENKTFIKRTLYGNGSTPFTTQSHTMGDITAFVLIGSNPAGSTIDLATIKAINWMFNEGSTAEAYEPYTSTVYGGTLTNEDDEWTLVVGKKYMLLNDDTKWENKTGTLDIGYQTNATDRKIFDNSYDGFICSCAGIDRSGSNTARWIGATSTTFGFKGFGLTLEKVKEDALANKISIVYELAEPTEYTLTESQALTLLQGENNIWCDASDDLELKYYATRE